MLFCVSSRDLIKVFKWYVDRVVDADHQDHIQQVLKVRPGMLPSSKGHTNRQTNKQARFPGLISVAACVSSSQSAPPGAILISRKAVAPLARVGVGGWGWG